MYYSVSKNRFIWCVNSELSLMKTETAQACCVIKLLGGPPYEPTRHHLTTGGLIVWHTLSERQTSTEWKGMPKLWISKCRKQKNFNDDLELFSRFLYSYHGQWNVRSAHSELYIASRRESFFQKNLVFVQNMTMLTHRMYSDFLRYV